MRKEIIMEQLYKRLANLLCVKSIVTLILTIVFAIMTIKGSVAADQFLTVFAVVISFYFGTQSERKTTQTDQKEQATNG